MGEKEREREGKVGGSSSSITCLKSFQNNAHSLLFDTAWLEAVYELKTVKQLKKWEKRNKNLLLMSFHKVLWHLKAFHTHTTKLYCRIYFRCCGFFRCRFHQFSSLFIQ